MKIKDQLSLKTGKQSITCECGKPVTARVSGPKKDRRGGYREYHVTCRACGTMFSGIIRANR